MRARNCAKIPRGAFWGSVEESVIRLRPHHLFCIQGFKGRGYDRAFTENFSALVHRVEQAPETMIQVVDGPDDVCAKCPHLTGERCGSSADSDRKVREHDQAVLRALGVTAFDVTSIGDVRQRLKEHAQLRREVLRLCSTCRWKDICGFYEEFSAEDSG